VIADELSREIDPAKIRELQQELNQAVRELLGEALPTPRNSVDSGDKKAA